MPWHTGIVRDQLRHKSDWQSCSIQIRWFSCAGGVDIWNSNLCCHFGCDGQQSPSANIHASAYITTKSRNSVYVDISRGISQFNTRRITVSRYWQSNRNQYVIGRKKCFIQLSKTKFSLQIIPFHIQQHVGCYQMDRKLCLQRHITQRLCCS